MERPVLGWSDGAGDGISRFEYATRAHVLDYMLKGGNTYRIVTDHLGSVRLVIDATTGAIAQEMSYDEFGRVLSDTNPGFQPFGFAGGLWDGQTGLVRFGARDYDPEVGRWTTKDPILFEAGDTNLYVYVGNDPINRSDPEGKDFKGCMLVCRLLATPCFWLGPGIPACLAWSTFACVASCLDDVCGLQGTVGGGGGRPGTAGGGGAEGAGPEG